METKKAITTGIIAIILIATAAIFAVKIVRKNSAVKAPVASTKSTSKTGSAGVAEQSSVTATSDSDIQAVEKDLNSVSEEDFNTNNLSDKAVGL